MNELLSYITGLSVIEEAVLAVFALAFVLQTVRWLGFSRLRSYRFEPERKSDAPGVSVVVVVDANQTEWINGDMKELLLQDYPNYEVVVVNDCGGEDISDLLQSMSMLYPRLKHTEIQKDFKFSHTSKLSKLVGIKAAKYDNVLFFEPWCRPSSLHWLSETAAGFVSDMSLTFGISLYGKESKPGNRFIRAFSMMSLIRSAKAALCGKPYLVSRTDFGFTKNIFFSSGGYSHLTTGYGDNDLYVRSLSKRGAVSFNPDSVVFRQQPDSFGLWFKELQFETSAYRLYPFAVRFGTFAELLSSAVMWLVFFCSAALFAAGYFRIPDNAVFLSAVLLLMTIRETVVAVVFSSVSKRLSEKGLLGSFLLYDIVAPVWESILSLCRRFGAPSRMW